MLPEDQYLGDGVYASFDGFGITLDLRGQKLAGEKLIEIYLEQEVWKALVYYINKVEEK